MAIKGLSTGQMEKLAKMMGNLLSKDDDGKITKKELNKFIKSKEDKLEKNDIDKEVAKNELKELLGSKYVEEEVIIWKFLSAALYF